MISGQTHTPVSFQLIETVRKGYKLLNKSSQNEVAGFIEGRQHETGFFIARDNTPDLYYSLFGAWLCEALELTTPLEKLKSSILSDDSKPYIKSSIDMLASVLINSLLPGEDCKKPGYLYLLNFLSGKETDINFVYRVFLVLLIYDTHYKMNSFFKILARAPIYMYNAPVDSPCSIHAALIIARHSAGMKAGKETEKLLSLFIKGKGFKVYHHLDNADLLSTAVSLFSLKKTGGDLRLIAQDCLGFIQDNYRNGAFIAGDGDESRDLEYTFYGLLALGALN